MITVSQPTVDLSSLNRGNIRLKAIIRDDNTSREVWFEYPEKLAESLTKLAHPWLLAALPFGLQTGQAICLDMPVDAAFLENINAWIRRFKVWFPQIMDVEIEAPTVWSDEQGEKSFSFFSGGVDSWFTLLRHTVETEGYPQVGTVDHTLTAWGFDIPLSNRPAFDKIADDCRTSLEPLGVNPIFVATNIREHESSWWKTHWGPITHGLGLAAVGHFLAPVARRILIPSGDHFRDYPPQGSHPDTDHLLSSSRTPFVHDHPLYKRIEKIECISRHSDVLKGLRVCWKQQSEKNCGTCEKCFRTMRALEILGLLDEATSFDIGQYRSLRRRQVYVDSELDLVFMISLCEDAQSRGNNELSDLLERNLATNRRIARVLRILKAIPGQPLAWRTESWLTRNMIK